MVISDVFAFKSNAACVKVLMGLSKSLVLFAFPNPTLEALIPVAILIFIMPDSNPFKYNDDGLAVQEIKPELKKPPLYKVILLNDDFTPMDFVIEILMEYFNMSEEKATQVMLQIHIQGIGVCGTYSKDVAETKVYIVNNYSRENQHPLMCSMEEV